MTVTGLFVPGSEKTIERTFAPVELSFRGTFAPEERKVQELSFHGTFVPWNFRSCRTFAPQERMFEELSFHGTFAPLEPSLHPQTTFVPFNFRTCGLLAKFKNRCTRLVITREAMSVSQSVSGTLDRPRAVAPSKTCGHVRSSRVQASLALSPVSSSICCTTFGRVVLAGASTPA